MDDRAVRHLTYVRLEDVVPAVRNPKNHTQPGLIASLERHGFTVPLLVDERTQRLVAGHGRYEALVEMKAAGDALPEGLLLDDDGEWLVPVIRGWSSPNEAAAQAYLLADNRLTESGGWDDRELVAVLEEIQVADATLFEALTWSTEELDDLFRLYREEGDPDAPQPTAQSTDPDESDDDTDDEDGESGSDRISRDIECPACGHHWSP